MQIRPIVVAAALLVSAHAAHCDADTDEDSAQPAAILDALLSYGFALENDVSPALTSILFGDLNGDGQPDAVVTYSHGVGSGGGNQYSQRLALFLNKAGRWTLVQHMKVGSKGSRFLTPVEIHAGEVRFSVTYWQPLDPLCCPTGASDTTFLFEEGRLRES